MKNMIITNLISALTFLREQDQQGRYHNVRQLVNDRVPKGLPAVNRIATFGHPNAVAVDFALQGGLIGTEVVARRQAFFDLAIRELEFAATVEPGVRAYLKQKVGHLRYGLGCGWALRTGLVQQFVAQLEGPYALATHIFLDLLLAEWPSVSTDLDYPVSIGTGDPKEAYEKAFELEQTWTADHPYGKASLELLAFLEEQLA